MKKIVRQLFKAVPGTGNVVLNFRGNPKSELGVLGNAYHRAGKILVRAFSEAHGYNDFDACPIAFSYRHAMELLIKAVLNLGNELAILTGDSKLATNRLFYEGHGFKKHLATIRAIFEAVGWKDAFTQAGIPHAEAIIQEFEAVDPGGFTFRYTIRKDGTGSTAPHFTFAPTEFAAILDPVLDALYGACLGLEEYRDMAADYNAELADNYHSDYFE